MRKPPHVGIPKKLPERIGNAILRASYQGQLEYLERKFADPANYVDQPMRRQRDGTEIEFLKLSIEKLDLKKQLTADPPPPADQIAEIQKKLDGWPAEFAATWHLLYEMDKFVEAESQTPQPEKKQAQANTASVQAPPSADQDAAGIKKRIYENRAGQSTTRDAAKFLEIAVRTVRVRLRKGLLNKGTKKGFITNQSIIALLAEQSPKGRKTRKKPPKK